MTPPKSSKRLKDQNANTGRNRSFGGCATVSEPSHIEDIVSDAKQCRTRHMKCDEGKPTCLMCKHYGISCGGYEKTIFFASEDDDGSERFRRPLFTEEEREKMSMDLVYSVSAEAPLLNILSQIDEECDREESVAVDLCINRGPFGAFKLNQSIAVNEAFVLENLDLTLETVDFTDIRFSPSAFAFSPGVQHFFEAFVQDAGQVDMSSSNQTYGAEMDNAVEPITTSVHEHGILNPSDLQITTEQSPSAVSTCPLDVIPDCAVQLLKHYSGTVIGSLTPHKNGKTLWHILFLPDVKNTLAALSMGETLDHASLSTFYGTLSISAFNLNAVSKGGNWYAQACAYKQKAREYIRQALRSAYCIPKVAKYKSILMALLTMVQLSMIDGDWKQTECYLLESEKFIRLRGLHRRKSRKRRLLHHFYAFTRILHESLFLITTSSLQRIHVRLAVETSGLRIMGQDSASFRLSPWRNLVQKMLEVKSPEEGENDLHLEYPGSFSATMYPEIYGLPEEWLIYLSQVIRLGNEKESQPEGTSTLSLKEFSIRAKDLERCILSWRRPSTGTGSPDHRTETADDRMMRPLLDALQQALIVYFYRRIYDIDAAMLQQRARNTYDSLRQCDKADPGRIRYTSAFVWPAFIAACEAEESELQSCFGTWFGDIVQQSGQSSFKHMFAIIKQVWNNKNCNQGSSLTWLDFMKDSNVIQ